MRSATVIARARRRLLRCPAARAVATETTLEVPPRDDEGFTVRVRAGRRGSVVEFDGWYRRFPREEDALDCFEFGLSAACRLLVEYRGRRAVAWTVESREYGCWVPHRRVARRLVPFWRPPRFVLRQNRFEFADVVGR